jgi:RNA polymerase sigma-70 factor (ECF subfamily)
MEFAGEGSCGDLRELSGRACIQSDGPYDGAEDESMKNSVRLKRQDTSDLNDPELIALALEGEELAFRVIMERHNKRLYRVARAVLKNETEAEDVVQEAYLRAFAALPSFRGEASLATWLTRIALNEALGRKRKERPMVDIGAVIDLEEKSAEIIEFPTMKAEPDPERSIARQEIRQLLEAAVDGLPETFRVVFVMRDIEGMSIEETARFLDIRPETIKTRLHRARRLLRESLDEQLASTLKESFPFAGARCARMTEAVLKRMREAALG